MRRHPRPPLGPPGLGPPGPMRSMRGPPLPNMGLPPLPGMGPPHISSGISSCTNSNDPISMDSRLFVGNLNTVALNKEAVEAIFSPYGPVSGISLHKGFAFVQFRHPDDARWAGATEDGKLYAGQALDINIVSQPKNRSALKRTNSGKGDNESPKKSRQESPSTTTNQSLQRTLVTLSTSNDKTESNMNYWYLCLSQGNSSNTPPYKKFTSTAKNSTSATNQSTSARYPKSESASTYISASLSNLSSATTTVKNYDDYSDTDILICGNCKSQFTSLDHLVSHKKTPCEPKVCYRCQQDADESLPAVPTLLECATCDRVFVSAWALCLHCVQDHEMPIFKLETMEVGHLVDG